MSSKSYPHFKGCSCGNSADSEQLSRDNEWWINAPDYHNCFWSYFRHNTRPHTLVEVSNLLNLSISAITTIEKRAYKRLLKKLKAIGIENR